MKKLFYKIALQFVAKNIAASNQRLTATYLSSIGFQPQPLDNAARCFWVEPNMKDRDKIWITFENHYYRVWHGRDKTFIALESSKEWFDCYLMLVRNRDFTGDCSKAI